MKHSRTGTKSRPPPPLVRAPPARRRKVTDEVAPLASFLDEHLKKDASGMEVKPTSTSSVRAGDKRTEVAALEQRREKTRAIKQGMMQESLTGRIRLV